MSAAPKSSEQRRNELRLLAQQRQADRRDGYLCLSDIHSGYYDTEEHVSPWSISAQNVDAELMIFGKDWVSSETLAGAPDPERKRLGQGWNVPTNRNLRAYLRDHVGGLEFSQTYATNVFPFIKLGKKNAAIRAADMLYAARQYALPQLRIVSPLMAVCLGPPAFHSVSRAALDEGGQSASTPMPHVVFCGIEIYAVSHPSMYPGGKVAVEGRWKQIGERLVALRERVGLVHRQARQPES
ncbi:MAG TPA: hypothetical protein VM715_13345, partial [Candidatus Acidoferrum sp.]|nr:hypothetical protein [Candidatus Acidoferrum sp.]